MTGILFIVATPIGNLDDITFRAVEVLKSVDIVLAEDTRHSKKLLLHLDISKPIRAFHEHNEREKTKAIIGELHSGKSIALISDAGTPLISDPGYFLVAQAKKEGLSCPYTRCKCTNYCFICLGFGKRQLHFFRFFTEQENCKNKAPKKPSL